MKRHINLNWKPNPCQLIALVSFIFFIGPYNYSFAQDPNKILLKNFRPKSIYKTPETKPLKAAFPAIDMHSHPY